MASSDGSNNPVESGALDYLSIDRGRPIRIALYYALGALVWLAISGRVLSVMPVHSYALNLSVNTMLFYLVASHYTKTVRASIAAQEEALVRARGYFESSVEGIISVTAPGRFVNSIRAGRSCLVTRKRRSSVSR